MMSESHWPRGLPFWASAMRSGLVTLTVTSFKLTSITWLPDKNFQLSLGGLTNTLTFRIEAATNLGVGTTWTSLTNISNFNGTFIYNDLHSTNYRQRFYRAVWTR